MKRYRVVGEMTISVMVDVEAENEEEARKLAYECSVMGLCNQCAGDKEDEWYTSGELDGEPHILKVEEIDSEDD